MTNKYLEKIAESYSVKGHPGLGNGVLNTPNVNLSRHQYHQYGKETFESNAPVKGMLTGAAVGGLAGYALAKARGGMPGKAGLIAGGVGAMIGQHVGENSAHSKALDNLGIKHPMLIETEEKKNRK